jgi:hypothetical protein
LDIYDPDYFTAERVRVVQSGDSEYFFADKVRVTTFSDSDDYLSALKLRVVTYTDSDYYSARKIRIAQLGDSDYFGAPEGGAPQPRARDPGLRLLKEEPDKVVKLESHRLSDTARGTTHRHPSREHCARAASVLRAGPYFAGPVHEVVIAPVGMSSGSTGVVGDRDRDPAYGWSRPASLWWSRKRRWTKSWRFPTG